MGRSNDRFGFKFGAQESTGKCPWQMPVGNYIETSFVNSLSQEHAEMVQQVKERTS